MAKEWIVRNGGEYVEHKGVRQDVINDMKNKYAHNTYPFIFNDGKFVGGYQELISFKHDNDNDNDW